MQMDPPIHAFLQLFLVNSIAETSHPVFTVSHKMNGCWEKLNSASECFSGVLGTF